MKGCKIYLPLCLAPGIPKIDSSSNHVLTNALSREAVTLNIGDALIANMLKEVIIHCRASGIPPPTITWNLNGVNIQHNEIKFEDYKNGTLKIKRVMPTDEGSLQCLAGNAAGIDTAASSINVVGKIKIRRRSPKVFYKKGLAKFCKIRRKTPLSENFTKKLSCQKLSCRPGLELY